MSLNKSSPELLLDLINAASGTNYLAEDVSFGTPIHRSPAAPRNTDLVISPTSTAAFPGPRTLNYDRLSLNLMFAQVTRTIVDNVAYTQISHLLPVINTRYDLALSAEDILDGPIVRDGAGPHQVIIQARGEGLVYNGQVVYNLTVEDVEPEPNGLVIEGYFLTNSLNGQFTDDMDTSEVVSDPELPFLTVDDNLVAFASGGYRNEILALHSVYDNAVEFSRAHLYSSHNGAAGPWVNHGEVPDIEVSYTKGVFFKGMAYYYVLNRASQIGQLCRLRLTNESPRTYEFEVVLEASNCQSLVVLGEDEQLVVFGSYDMHISVDGLGWTREAHDLNAYTAYVHGGAIHGVRVNNALNGALEHFQRTGVNTYTFSPLTVPGFPTDEGAYQIYIQGVDAISMGNRRVMVLDIYIYDVLSGSNSGYRYGMIFTRDDGQPAWTQHLDGTQWISRNGGILRLGDTVAIAGGTHYEAPEGTTNWMAISYDRGNTFTIRDSSVLPFGSTLPHAWALVCHRTGAAPAIPELPERVYTELTRSPTDTNNDLRFMYEQSDGWLVGHGGYYWNQSEGQRWEGSRVISLSPLGRVNLFRHFDLYGSVKDILPAGNDQFYMTGNYEIDGNSWFKDGTSPVQLMYRINANLTPDFSWQTIVADRLGYDGIQPVQTNCAALQTDGKILVGGDFSTIDGEYCWGLLRINADGTHDTSFTSPLTEGDGPDTIVALPSGRAVLYGSNASSALGTGRTIVVDNSGAILPQMADLGSGTETYSAFEDAQGRIYLAGSFFDSNDEPQNIIRLNADGTRDTGWVQPDGEYRFAGEIGIDGQEVPHPLVSRKLQSQDEYVLCVMNPTTGAITPYAPHIATSGHMYNAQVTQSGHLLVGGQFDNFYGGAYPVRGTLMRENVFRAVLPGAVDTFNEYVLNYETNTSLGNPFQVDGGESNGLGLTNPDNRYFSAAHNFTYGTAARFSGATNDSETSPQAQGYVTPSTPENLYRGILRWYVDLVFHSRQGIVANDQWNVLFTLGGTNMELTVIRDADSDPEFPVYYLVDAQTQTPVVASSWQSNGGASPIEHVVMFSLHGQDITNLMFPGGTAGLSFNGQGYVSDRLDVSILHNGYSILSIAGEAVDSEEPPGEYPTMDYNVALGGDYAPGGEVILGQTGGDANDGNFARSLGYPNSTENAVNPIVALRAYDTNSMSVASDSTGHYVLGYRDSAPGTAQVLDLVLAHLNDGWITNSFRFTLQFTINDGNGSDVSVMLYRGEQRMNYGSGWTEFWMVPDPEFTWASEFIVNWMSWYSDHIQMRYSLNDLLQNVPSNVWDGTGMVSGKIIATLINVHDEVVRARVEISFDSHPDATSAA